MRYQQSGSTPQQGSQQGSQDQMNQSGTEERKQWPFKAFEYPAETGVQEFSVDGLKEQQSRPRRSRQMQAGGQQAGSSSSGRQQQGGQQQGGSDGLSRYQAGTGPSSNEQFSQDQNRFPRRDEQGQLQRQPRGEEEDASGQS